MSGERERGEREQERRESERERERKEIRERESSSGDRVGCQKAVQGGVMHDSKTVRRGRQPL
jgi:hypothetical protein